ncbi:MAG: hypothetical protein JJU37_04160 [Balneolaceae bacterium]|nr:hypothetical protein [Balneolaceae bacterium]
MKHVIQTSATLMLLGLLLFSCENISSPNSDVQNKADRVLSLNPFSESNNEFVLKDEESTPGVNVTVNRIPGSGETTFEYVVENNIPSPGNRTVQFFNLELPSCLGQPTFTPDLGEGGSISNDGITWNQTISAPSSGGSSANNSRTYSITYEGNVSAGEINAKATSGGEAGRVFSGVVLGPICPSVEVTITFSGSVYIDANEDNTKDPEEYGLDNIEVSLYSFVGDDETLIGSQTTGVTGEFSFEVEAISGINFRIKVPENKVDNVYYQAIPVTSRDFLNVTEDVENIHFAYVLDIDQMVADLLSGEILKNTKSTQYWAFQLQHAAVNQRQVDQNPNVDFTRAKMNTLLETVEGLLPIVEEPFKFEGNNEREKIQDALRILRGQKYEDSELSDLMKELLTAELNVANELGALTPEGEINDPFNRAILIFGEAIACNALGTCPVGTVVPAGSAIMGNLIVGGTDGLTSSATLSDGTTVLRAFNGTGGIGSN